MSNNYVDIPGLVDIQKQYIMNSPVLSDGNHNDQLMELNKKITDLQNVLLTNDGPGIITEQHEMSDIVNNESIRLAKKQESITSAVTSQNRLITLNTNYSKKFAEYIKMTLALSAGLVVIAVLIVFRFSSGLITITGIIVGSIVMIYCTYVYADISSRDNVYFDELNMDSMSKPQSKATPANIAKYENSLGNLNPFSCYGADCCAYGTEFDEKNQKCQIIVEPVKEKDNFKILNSENSEMPFKPNEYDAYTKI